MVWEEEKKCKIEETKSTSKSQIESFWSLDDFDFTFVIDDVGEEIKKFLLHTSIIFKLVRC